MKNIFKRIAILGASRGLGFALAQVFTKELPDAEYFLSSRKIKKVLAESTTNHLAAHSADKIKSFVCDFSKLNQLDPLISELSAFSPTHLYYVAGGGPFGEFQNKNWSDHLWAIHVNLLFPGELLHRILNLPNSFAELQQILFVGSNIAENAPDPKSASYAMAKHGLKGLITSIQHENPKIDLRLFSPGYIDTPLLPPNAWPRLHQKTITQPNDLAQILYNWSIDPQFKNQHFRL